VKSIVDAKCVPCHTEGGIAPFALTDPEVVASMHASLADSVASGSMPPWPPERACAPYKHDRSLTEAEVATLTAWSAAGGLVGDASSAPAPAASPLATLTRVDRTLVLPGPYTPKTSPDDYHCFILDWPDAAARFITGFGVQPDQAAIVHHVIAYAVPPEGLPALEKLDAEEPGPGYTCFGGPGNGALGATRMLGAWAPGSLGKDMPPGTGIRVEPGSKIVVQVHYNTHGGPPVADQSSLALRVDDAVEREARTLFFTDFRWVRDRTMRIPAGEKDVAFSFAYDAVEFVSRTSRGTFPPGQALTLHGAGLHMHTRGARASLRVERAAGDSACVLSIPRWDFHWQGSYDLAAPLRLEPGDRLSIECHFDNSAENQPTEDGRKVPPRDLNWGEGTHDEMCLGWVYVTQ
jgi:hypothetical protein